MGLTEKVGPDEVGATTELEAIDTTLSSAFTGIKTGKFTELTEVHPDEVTEGIKVWKKLASSLSLVPT